jgi:hypothetical protein
MEEESGIGNDVIPSVLKNGRVHWLRYAHTWLVAVLVVWYARERESGVVPFRTVPLCACHTHTTAIYSPTVPMA